MSKIWNRQLWKRAFAALAAAALLAGSFGCAGPKALRPVQRALGVDVSAGTVLVSEDNHSAPRSDGETFIAAAFDPAADGKLTQSLASDGRWNKLPLTDTLSRALYGDSAHDSLAVMGGENAIPEIQNGYYRFIDRYKGTKDAADDSLLFTRSAYHFTVALYDADARVLYYYALDL